MLSVLLELTAIQITVEAIIIAAMLTAAIAILFFDNPLRSGISGSVFMELFVNGKSPIRWVG